MLRSKVISLLVVLNLSKKLSVARVLGLKREAGVGRSRVVKNENKSVPFLLMSFFGMAGI